MRTRAVAVRILNQIRHDRRTVALILIAPVLVLTLVYFIFEASGTEYQIGIINSPDSFVEELKNVSPDNDVIVKTGYTVRSAKKAIESEEITAAIDADKRLSGIKVYIDGTDSSKASKIRTLISQAAAEYVKKDMKDELDKIKKAVPATLSTGISVSEFTEPDIDTDYLYGIEDGSFFDNFGAPLVGIIIFFFVFLIAGINFLNERKSGTLEKLLSTPVRRGEIIGGYVLGFGILAVIQSAVITLYVVYVLGISIMGNIMFVLMVNLLTGICALTLGMLLSTLASSEFQMIQFIPIVILPQIFLCGLFELSGGWDVAGHFIPLYYTTHALMEVMLRGSGFDTIWHDCVVLAGCAVIFMILNTGFLKRQRRV